MTALARIAGATALLCAACQSLGSDRRSEFTAELSAAQDAAGALPATCAYTPVYVTDQSTVEAECDRIATDGCYRSGSIVEESFIVASDYGGRPLTKIVTHEYVHCLLGLPDHGDRFWKVYYPALRAMGID